jgi:hypothetical protein
MQTSQHTTKHTQLVLGRAHRAMEGEGSVGRDSADESRGESVLQAQAAVQLVNVRDQLSASRESRESRESR